MGVEPELDPLRGEPEFEELLIKTRNPAVGRPDISEQAAAAAVARRRSELRATSAPVTSPVMVPAEQTHAGINEEARRLYTAGRYYSTRRSAEGLKQAIERLERAVELDPDYALAHAELADCYALLNWLSNRATRSLATCKRVSNASGRHGSEFSGRRMRRSALSGCITIVTGQTPNVSCGKQFCCDRVIRWRIAGTPIVFRRWGVTMKRQ